MQNCIKRKFCSDTVCILNLGVKVVSRNW